MNRYFLALIFLNLFSVKPLSAQGISFPDLQGYRKNTSFPVYTKDNLEEFNNSFAEVCLSYGFINLYIAEYKKGKNEIRIEIYRLSYNVLAFGIYSLDRSGSDMAFNTGNICMR